MTSDRNLFNDSDAILFHAYELDPQDLPAPSWRRPHQHYVFVLYESPANTDLNMLRLYFPNFFNRTMTYRLDSDIVELHPYGRIKCKDLPSTTCRDFPLAHTSIQITTERHHETTVNNIDAKIDLSKKNRTIAWFVSNCQTDSKRELLVNNLMLHIRVDIYGPCSNLSCPRERKADCGMMLSRYYRFYLSFENSLCPDYVTEKLYRAMIYDTVPVVFGGSNYSSFLPIGSFVNAMDFGSPLELANHLKKMMEDDDLYLSYFRWTGRYVVELNPLDGMCQLCNLLGDPSVGEKIYSDIEAWWAGRLTNKTCFAPPESLNS